MLYEELNYWYSLSTASMLSINWATCSAVVSLRTEMSLSLCSDMLSHRALDHPETVFLCLSFFNMTSSSMLR